MQTKKKKGEGERPLKAVSIFSLFKEHKQQYKANGNTLDSYIK